MTRSILIIFTAITLSAWGCNPSSNKNGQDVNGNMVQNPATLDGDTAGKKLPAMTFETMEHDFGKVKEGDKVEYDFKFVNSGKAPLLISSVKASCGCTTPDWPKSLVQPGDTNMIKVEYNSKGREGEFSKAVVITANTYPNATTLKISGVVFKQ